MLAAFWRSIHKGLLPLRASSVDWRRSGCYRERMKLHWLATGLLALALDAPPAGAAPKPKRQIDPSLVALQSELASLDGPEGYYSKAYRPSETLFWSNLPGWMR